jgi:hypothetical protein
VCLIWGLADRPQGSSAPVLDNGFMKVFISFDMEGLAGIVDSAQCRPRGQAYEEGRAVPRRAGSPKEAREMI